MLWDQFKRRLEWHCSKIMLPIRWLYWIWVTMESIRWWLLWKCLFVRYIFWSCLIERHHRCRRIAIARDDSRLLALSLDWMKTEPELWIWNWILSLHLMGLQAKFLQYNLKINESANLKIIVFFRDYFSQPVLLPKFTNHTLRPVTYPHHHPLVSRRSLLNRVPIWKTLNSPLRSNDLSLGNIKFVTIIMSIYA